MAHFLFTRPSGIWDVSPLEPAEIADLDSKTERAVNGDDGGTWAPTSKITIGGAGLYVPDDFSAGDIGGRNPALHVTAGQVTLPAGADLTFSSGSTVTVPTGAIVTMAGTGKIQGPGGNFVVNDGQPIKYSPARVITDYPIPCVVGGMSAFPSLTNSGAYLLRNSTVHGLVVTLFVPMGMTITSLSVPMDHVDVGNGGSGPTIQLFMASKFNVNSPSVVGNAVAWPTTSGVYDTLEPGPSLTTSNGGLPSGGLVYFPGMSFRLHVYAPTAGDIFVSTPIVSGTLSEIGSL